ncbi:MAG: PAS domain S-box protein [Chloroflexota bacterium]
MTNTGRLKQIPRVPPGPLPEGVITAPLRAQAPKDSALLYRRIFEGAAHGVLILDARTGIVQDANRYLIKMCGYTRADFVGQKFWDVEALSDIEAGRPGLEALQAGDQVHRQGLTLRAKGGNQVEVEFECNVFEAGNQKLIQCHIRDTAAWTQKDESLPAPEVALRALFAAMQDAVLVLDRQGVYRKIAPTQPGLLSSPPHELLGKNLRDVFPPEAAAAFLDVIGRVLDTRQTLGIEYQLAIGGRPTWFATSISPLDADSTLWVAHDITRRRQNEDALREAEAKYRNIVDNATEGIYQSTPAGDFFTANPALARILGYDSPEELFAGVKDLNLGFYVQAGRRAELLRRLTDDGEIRNAESQVYGKDGGKIWISENARVVHDRGGAVHYEGTLVDVTARKRVEEALRAAEANYRSLFENSPVGIYQSTPQGRFLNVNQAMARIFGYGSPAEMIECIKNIEEQVNVDPAQRREFRRKIEEQGSLREFRCRAKRKDGTTIWTQEDARAVTSPDGSLLYYEGFVIDITERRRADEQLRDAQVALETMNRDLQQSLTREETLSRTDGLTGLANRLHFDERAAQEFQAAARYGRPLTIMIVDVDHFKHINDTFGHVTGDRTLVLIAQSVAADTRGADLLARMGGDELVLLLPETTAQQALPLAERIRARAGTLRVGGNAPLSISLSIGIAELCREPMDASVEDIFRRADRALYRAKESGRNRVCVDDQQHRKSTA